VNRATNIFAASMLHRLVRGKTLTNCFAEGCHLYIAATVNVSHG